MPTTIHHHREPYRLMNIMSSDLIDILIIVALILLNGVFAMSELAVMSARKARLQEQANRGSASAQKALDLAENPNNFLSTVQVGITLVGVMSGAFGGATLSDGLSREIAQIEPLEPYADALGFGVVVVLITYGSLVIGELVPKRLALKNPERVAALVAGPMHWLARLAYPVVYILGKSTNAVLALLRAQTTEQPPVTEEEIRIMIEEGTEAGVFHAAEQNMVENVFRLDESNISALMTPHTEIAWLDLRASREAIRDKIKQHRFSHLPVCEGNLDKVIGIARTKDLLLACLSDDALDLNQLTRPAIFLPENAPAAVLVERFKRSEDHVIIVIDEFGGVQGLVSEHDILEAFVGNIPSRGESGSTRATQREDDSWMLDGLMRIDEVKDLFNLRRLPGEERGEFETVGGFVMSRLGEIPQVGQCFKWQTLVIEVAAIDGHRVDKVIVRRLPADLP